MKTQSKRVQAQLGPTGRLTCREGRNKGFGRGFLGFVRSCSYRSEKQSNAIAMSLLKLLTGHHRSLAQHFGRRYFSSAAAAASTEEYAKRNYANNVSEYNTVIDSITAQRRHFLLRDVYEDMVLDGVQPTRDTFHSLIAGTMKGARLQDAFFFTDEMKSMGLVPDVTLYNILISLCGKCHNSDQAIRVLEDMKIFEVKPMVQSYVCLLNACAAAGRLDRVYAIIRDMTAAGLGLNKYCYAGLITAYKNKTPVPEDFASKIIEFVERSKEWTSVESSSVSADNMMMGVSLEELYNMPTADYAHRRGGFISNQLTIYHVAFHACADLKNVKLMETLSEMLQKDGKVPDTFITMQIMRCYLHSGDLDNGLKTFEDYMNSGRSAPAAELFVTLVEGAMLGYTPKGMQIAQDTLVNMNSRGFFLSPKMGSDLLLQAAGEKTGGYTIANLIWDMMQTRRMTPTFPAVQAYYNGLKTREIPADDPRLLQVTRIYQNLRERFGPGRS
ncbi:pentatricopeptide repeat-containing protein At4g35850, mitochondrial [Cannabis sativa]|uniref:pentatricopeptide repeat-containing protein At4g35850, mitochondrial n=1 Tax=Cannabis sativa TaxID=3483 RepID=UPI0029CA42F7|nr:pentatricopeptide repeat-containing protein At4g35850, mitochondrial [Cannabis sativa]